jgi:hypothetical protein
MLAFRSSKITIACGEDFLYELNADPAGGRDTTVTGEPASPSTSVVRTHAGPAA